MVLHGHSGSGKSTLLRRCTPTIYPTKVKSRSNTVTRGRPGHRASAQSGGNPQNHRRWVSQFLRVIPRISALEVVMSRCSIPAFRVKPAPLKPRVFHPPERAGTPVAPGTIDIFRCEQQRVNIARGFIVDYPILLLTNLPPRWTPKTAPRWWN